MPYIHGVPTDGHIVPEDQRRPSHHHLHGTPLHVALNLNLEGHNQTNYIPLHSLQLGFLPSLLEVKVPLRPAKKQQDFVYIFVEVLFLLFLNILLIFSYKENDFVNY